MQEVKHVEVVSHPAVTLAYHIVTNLQDAVSVAFESEGAAIIATANVLMAAERQGKLTFTED